LETAPSFGEATMNRLALFDNSFDLVFVQSIHQTKRSLTQVKKINQSCSYGVLSKK
jgi:hypothetical protein